MTTYQIENISSGHVFGLYEGSTADEAILAMLADAGDDGEPADDIQATPIPAVTLNFVSCATRLDDVRFEEGLRVARDILGDCAALARAHFIERFEGRAYDASLADLWDRAELAAVRAACAGWAIIPDDIALVAR